MEEDEEFKVPDYDEEIENVKALVKSCRTEIESNNIQVVPYFNEIVSRELDAIIDTLTKIDHFHASARCVRAALELTAVNLYRYFYPSGRLLSISFWEKYWLRSLSHRTKSPLLELVGDGVLWEEDFHSFRESYKALSDYVHFRVTYELCHTLPEKIRNPQYYVDVLRLAGKKTSIARIVKATLIKYSLEPALETLLRFVRKHKDLPVRRSL